MVATTKQQEEKKKWRKREKQRAREEKKNHTKNNETHQQLSQTVRTRDNLEANPEHFREFLIDAQYHISSNLVVFKMFAP